MYFKLITSSNILTSSTPAYYLHQDPFLCRGYRQPGTYYFLRLVFLDPLLLIFFFFKFFEKFSILHAIYSTIKMKFFLKFLKKKKNNKGNKKKKKKNHTYFLKYNISINLIYKITNLSNLKFISN